MASFFYYGHLSSASILQAPTQRPIIDQCPVKQTAYRREIKDNGYKSIFTISWLVRQRNRSWIKGLGKNPKRVSSFIACSAFCPGPPNRDPMDSEKLLRVYKSSATMARHSWRVDKAPAKKSKCVLRSSPIRCSQNKLRVYTASDANWLQTE